MARMIRKFKTPSSYCDLLMGRSLLTIKGAPDVLIGRCTHYISAAGDTHELNETARGKIEEIKDQWSSQGRRVILLARKILSKAQMRFNDLESEALEHSRSGLTLVGMVSIVDPPRDEIPEVVRTLRGAGIRIFMVAITLSFKTVTTMLTSI